MRVLENKEPKITQGYSNSHHALDLVAVGKQYNELDYIVSADDGKIVMFQDGMVNEKGSTGNRSYGNFVKIEHKNGYHTLYAHMKKGLSVKSGQTVKKGQRLGYMSDSGNSYGGHLHFEVWKNGVRINPYDYVFGDKNFEVLPVPVERDEDKKQIKVLVTELRCRSEHNVTDNTNILGFVPQGIYNIVSEYKDETYTWYEIEPNKWIADNGEWCEVLDIVKPEPTPVDPEPTPVEPEEPADEKKDNIIVWLMDLFIYFVEKIQSLFKK